MAASKQARVVSRANSEFCHDLHKILTTTTVPPNFNMVYSPFSLSVVLAMAKLGARNQTSLEMQKVCHFPKDDTTLASGYKELQAAMEEANKDPHLELVAANRLYKMHGYDLNPQFVAALQTSFMTASGVAVKQVDFGRSAASAKEINDWVEKVTKDKIKDLLAPEMLSGLTRLVLVNAVYFKGLWEYPFNKANTTKANFAAIVDGAGKAEMVEVDMMRMGKKLPYAKLSEFCALALPYQGGALEMLIILPNQSSSGLKQLQNLPVNHESLYAKMKANTEVALCLPRFRIESTHALVDPLKRLGLGTMFDERADFSGIGGTSGELFVSAVVQKAFVEVNEEGTEAAAATGMVMSLRCRSQPKIIHFNVDRPFLFQIIHKPSDLVLFAGCVTNPLA